MSLTELMLAKIETALDRTQRAMKLAEEKGQEEVVQMNCQHYFRLVPVREYLYERLSR